MKITNKQINILILLLIGITALFLITFGIVKLIESQYYYYDEDTWVSDGICNIAVIPIVGEITSYDGGTFNEADFEDMSMVSADHLVRALRNAENDPLISGVLFRIDSSGGGPVASEIVADAINRSSLLSVSLIRETGTSGAYLIATGADTIIGSKLSDIGGIGITMSYLQNVKQNKQDGIEFIELISAPFKEYGNPNKELSKEERNLFQRDVKVFHDALVKKIAENRKMIIEDVEKLADGSSMPGELALKTKLIDQLGDQDTSQEWFAEQLSIAKSEIIFCE